MPHGEQNHIFPHQWPVGTNKVFLSHIYWASHQSTKLRALPLVAIRGRFMGRPSPLRWVQGDGQCGIGVGPN